MIAVRTTLPGETQQHFNLRHDPFTGDPHARCEVFSTPQLDRIAARLEDAINYQSFVALVGEIGAGKTMMRKRVVDFCRKE